jgi:uncharacterized alpha-E superfamily protein
MLTAPPPPSPVRETFTPRRVGEVMLSRVAASLYWISRYLERAENTARLLDVNLQLLLDFHAIDDETLKQHWIPILRSADEEEGFAKLYDTANSRNVTEYMTFCAENPNSVYSCVNAARENARQVRDQISLEMWEILNVAYLFFKEGEARRMWNDGEGAAPLYDRVKSFSHLFQGLTDATFSRNEGYEFLQFGKYMERADKTTRILDIKYHILLPKVSDVGGAVDTVQWQALLRSASALEAYRRFFMAEILPRKVAEFLIFSESFPRSIRYCLQSLDDYLHRLTGTAPGDYPTPSERAFGKLLNDLNFLGIEDIFRMGFHEYLTFTQRVLTDLDAHIFRVFMYYPPVDVAAEIRLHQQEQQQQQ